ncbi:MAG: Hpt domain-containing protein, partial [Alcanivorax sp.]|nr:Hpt domain-containing protein [Alcanivorax sp.]
MQENDKALQSFLIESDENLGQLEQDIVALERSPQDSERIASAFRAIHTIKGTCGFFGFTQLETLSHALEDILGTMRDGNLHMDLPHATALLDGVDEIRVFLKRIHNDGKDGEPAPQALIDRLHALIPARKQSDALASPPQITPSNPEPEHPEPTVIQAHQETPAHSDTVLEKTEPETSSPQQTAKPDTTVRVDVVLLDKLMNVVGELVLTRNQLLQHTASQNDAQLVNLSQRLNMVTSELQEGLMQTRMQPIRNAWSTYPRLLLDLERKTGKRVTPVLRGGDTELDRSLLEAIRDPLIHLVR